MLSVCREMYEEDPFFDIISYDNGPGRVDIRMTTRILCADDICFENSKLVKSETYDPVTESSHAAREKAFAKCAADDDYFARYKCSVDDEPSSASSCVCKSSWFICIVYTLLFLLCV